MEVPAPGARVDVLAYDELRKQMPRSKVPK
jgi:hypothetical protein